MQPPDAELRVIATAPEDEATANALLEQTEDPELRGELAAEALLQVERQLQLTNEQRRQLDSAEAKLWARQNRLEGILISTRGSAWWRERRAAARTKALATGRPSIRD